MDSPIASVSYPISHPCDQTIMIRTANLARLDVRVRSNNLHHQTTTDR
jgi:hypothetical protein